MTDQPPVSPVTTAQTIEFIEEAFRNSNRRIRFSEDELDEISDALTSFARRHRLSAIAPGGVDREVIARGKRLGDLHLLEIADRLMDAGKYIDAANVVAASEALRGILSLSPQAPAGGVDRDWVLVPREPTEAMIEAFLKPRRMEFDGARAFWTAMLAAAPKPVESTAIDGLDRTPQPGFKIIDAKDGGRAVVRDDLSERMKAGEPYSGELHWPSRLDGGAQTAAPLTPQAPAGGEAKLREALKTTTSHLVAAISLLRKYHEACAPTKRHALFGTMIADYEKAAEIGRAVIAEPAPVGDGRAHIFLDCDGVLADFDTYAEAYFGMPPRQYEKQVGSDRFWKELEAKGDFYRNLPLMPDANALVDGVRHLKPTILTGCPRGNWAEAQKIAWAHEHFPDIPVITCRSADKRLHAKPGDVLIDDWPQHRHRWIEMGGVFISHADAATSLAALWAHYPALAQVDGEGSK